MAHLDLTLVHLFSDGNGRLARCLQSCVLASAGVLSPVFWSVEEYLGRNTDRYYAVLTEVAQGSWSPGRDTRPWIQFILTAHFRQARTLERRIHETDALWDRCGRLARERGVPDRSVAGEEISDDSATRDLKALVDAGLLAPEVRGRPSRGCRTIPPPRSLTSHREASDAREETGRKGCELELVFVMMG